MKKAWCLNVLQRMRRQLGVGDTLSIRGGLVRLVFACVLPGTLMAAFMIVRDYRLQRAHLIDGTVATARALTFALDRELASIESGLRVLATSPSLVSDDLPEFHARAQEALHSQNANNYVLVDASGNQRINTLRPLGDALPNIGAHPMQRIFHTNATVVSDLFIGAVTRRPLIAIGVPVHRNGQIVYSLNVGIFPERLTNLLRRQRLPATWIGAIVDRNGKLLARTHEPERFVGKEAAPDLMVAARNHREGTIQTDTLEGIPVITSFTRSEISGWSVAVGMPRAQLYAQLSKSLLLLVASSVALLGIGLAVAWHFGGRIARSVNALVAPAMELGNGMAIKVEPLYLREADAVGRALELASSMLVDAQYRANYDGLTGLANRALFNEMLNQQVAACIRSKSDLSVLFIDLDGFKLVNDAHGHRVGDELLRAVASRIKGAVRDSDIVARFGGDEFVVLQPQTRGESAAVTAAKLVALIAAPMRLCHVDIGIAASIGIAVFPDAATSAQGLLECADAAMYAAKNAGKGQFVFAGSLEHCDFKTSAPR